MNQILSQNEVEALLKAVGDDNLDEGVAGQAGGKLPPATVTGGARAAMASDRRFEEVRPLLEDLFDKTLRIFRSFLLGALAKDLSVERFSIEAVGYQDFTRRYDLYGRPYTFMPFELTPPERTGVVIFEPGLAIGLMEGFMGGTLDSDPVPTWRLLTTLELQVAERMNRELLSAFGQSLQSQLGIAVEPRKIMTNAHLVKGMKDMTSVVAVGIRILIRGKPLGECYVLMPQDVMESFKKEDNPTILVSDEEMMQWDQKLIEGLFDVGVEVTAVLGTAALSVNRLVGLKAGDRISLKRGRPGEAVIQVEGIPKMKAVPGVFRGRKALRLV